MSRTGRITTMDFEDPGRYARQLALPGFGAPGQAALSTSRVLVIGAGGLGSFVLPLLAAAGVGTLGVIDDDRVELSNLHRQPIHGTASVGLLKVDSAAETLTALNPGISLVPMNERLTTANALELFARFDLVVDGSDNFPTRYLANDAAAVVGIPLVWGAVSQYAGQAGVAWAQRGPQYRDLFPAPPRPGSVLSCADGGVMPTVCAVIGSVMANEVIKILTGIGEPLLGRVVTFDAHTGMFRDLAYERDPSAAPITGLTDYDVFCGITPAATAGVISAEQLARELDAGIPLTLLDVREPWEAAIVSLPNSVLIPLGELERSVQDVPTDRPVVAYCHHGIRSQQALDLLRVAGIRNARHLSGGIDAWSSAVDPALARY